MGRGGWGRGAGLTQAAVADEALDDGAFAAQVLRHRGAAHLQVTHLGGGVKGKKGGGGVSGDTPSPTPVPPSLLPVPSPPAASVPAGSGPGAGTAPPLRRGTSPPHRGPPHRRRRCPHRGCLSLTAEREGRGEEEEGQERRLRPLAEATPTTQPHLPSPDPPSTGGGGPVWGHIPPMAPAMTPPKLHQATPS